MKVVLASNNAGKVKEFNELLAPLGFEVLPQSLFGISSCEEPYPTFVENALAKARHASRLSCLPALADDSGICVKALEGRPGVLSARYALSDHKKSPSDADNNARLIRDLQNVTERQAHFISTLVYIRYPGDPEPVIATGYWQGEIIDEARGSGGFGYDPHFLIPELHKTAAQLSAEDKNKLSHRGQALQLLLKQLQALA